MKLETEINGSKEDFFYCDFCGTTNDFVEKMVTGPKVCICDVCIEKCYEIIHSEGLNEQIPR